MQPVDLCLNLTDVVNKGYSLTSTCVPLHRKLPILTTRWHSCIESRKEQHSEASTSYVTSCINITVCFYVMGEWQQQFTWLFPTHSIYFSEGLISVTLRGKPRGALLMLLCFRTHVCTFGHMLCL